MDRESADRIVDSYVGGWRDGDRERILRTLDEECVVVECYGPVYRGRRGLKPAPATRRHAKSSKTLSASSSRAGPTTSVVLVPAASTSRQGRRITGFSSSGGNIS